MKIIVSILIGVFLFTGCSTKDNGLSLDTQKTNIQLKNSKNITLFVMQSKDSTSNHGIFSYQGGYTPLSDKRYYVNLKNNIEHTKASLKEEGFRLTSSINRADYVLLLDKASLKNDGKGISPAMKMAEYNLGQTIYRTQTLTLKFLLTKPENIDIYAYKNKVLDMSKVSSFSDSISWQKIRKVSYWSKEKTIKNRIAMIENETANFPKAYKIITKKILVQMDQEYVFDD